MRHVRRQVNVARIKHTQREGMYKYDVDDRVYGRRHAVPRQDAHRNVAAADRKHHHACVTTSDILTAL